MKQLKYILIIIGLIFATIAQSQSYIGFQAGYTKASEDYGNAVVPDDARTHIHGAMAGLIVRREFGRAYIDLEPQYRRRGAACFPGFVRFVGDTEFQLDYFELPVTIGFKALKMNRVDISPRIGYSLAYFLGGNSITYRGLGEDRISEETPLDQSDFNSIDHTFHFGVQTGYALDDKITLLGTVNHSRGLVNTVKEVSSKHRAIAISLGMLYKL